MSELSAMTVNERFWALGLDSEWENAVKSNNREAMIQLLGRAELADQAEWIVAKLIEKNSI